MKGWFSVTMVLVSFVGLHGQQRMSTSLQKDVRIERNKPSVYITFERVGELKSPDPGDEKERVWLRLHNNTRWPLVLQMSATPSAEYGDAGLFYENLSGDEVVFRIQCHVCTLNTLRSGKSLLFSIPRSQLTKERTLRVKFSYAWEDQNDVAAGREATHYVYFNGSQLPHLAQQSKK
jgi:hypothetical protein